MCIYINIYIERERDIGMKQERSRIPASNSQHPNGMRHGYPPFCSTPPYPSSRDKTLRSAQVRAYDDRAWC